MAAKATISTSDGRQLSMLDSELLGGFGEIS
jgi:hypothetical protein